MHIPNPGGNRMNHRNAQIVFRRNDIFDTPSAGAEQIDALRRWKFVKRRFEMLIDRLGRNFVRLVR